MASTCLLTHNSAILRHSCYKEATFYLTMNVFGVNNLLFRGNITCSHICCSSLILQSTAIANALIEFILHDQGLQLTEAPDHEEL